MSKKKCRAQASQLPPQQCETCNGPGIVSSAYPSCKLLVTAEELNGDWVVVERCDDCQRFIDDMNAATHFYEECVAVDCENGKDTHVLARGWRSDRR